MTRNDATVDRLLSKAPRTKELVLQLDDSEELVVRVRAIGAKAYDVILASCPPTKAQKEEGMSYDPDTFAPALVSASLVVPEMTKDQAVELWTSDSWSRGELSDLFYACVEVNSKGLDVPFTKSG